MTYNEATDYIQKAWSILGFTIFEVGGQRISILSFVTAAFVFYLTHLAAKYVDRGVSRLLAERKDLDSGVKDSIKRFTKYTILSIGALLALDTVGVKLSSLAAVGAVLMVGIGFGLQNITQNFISGLIILLERPIKVGDLVEVKGVSGKVLEIGARSTLINTRDEVAIIVPNSQFISEQVINESLSSLKTRYHVNVGVAYGSDVKKVQEVLLEIARENPRVLNSPDPKVFFKDFGASSLDFRLSLWISDMWHFEAILSEIRFTIDEKFRENKVEIPFQQVDLHFRDRLSFQNENPLN
ncbi:MAG: mechanosensitive ion channel [Halobacteriovoraceae bacterium]|nr:mechanosensitive ion channel [Halobacteriovoraceae bacterium]